MSETTNGGSARPLGAVDVPRQIVVPEVDIHVVGYGNRLPNDFTLELLAVLKGCRRVFGAPPIHAPEFGIPAMEDLAQLAGDSHAEMAEVVLAAAASDPPVALARSGSAMVGESAAHHILALAAQHGLSFHVTNAVPSFDAIWANLNIEPFYGFEIWAADTFARLAIAPSTHAHLLLSGVPLHDGGAVSALRGQLLDQYAATHEVHVVAAAVGIGPRPRAAGIESIALGDLRDRAGAGVATLVVPRAERAAYDFERPEPVRLAAGKRPEGTITEPTQDGILEVPWNLVVPEVDIHLVGYGNRLPNDLTLEALAVLKRCKRVFAVPPIHAPEFGIPAMESLMHLYSPERRRLDTYGEWARIVLDAAAADPPVAFATYGSAMVGTFVTHRLIELAAQRGLSLHVTNATSSFDGIWADFDIDPCDGFEIWEATAFMRLEIVPNPCAHLLLPQAPMLDVTGGIDTERMCIEASSTVSKLRDYLLRFYASDHEVHFDTTASGAGEDVLMSEIETVSLRDLDHPGRRQASTLIVPRVDAAGSQASSRATKGRRDAIRAR